MPGISLSIIGTFAALFSFGALATGKNGPVMIDLTTKLSPSHQALIDSASELLETANISYAMGGAKLGDDQACNSCNECLAKVEPKPKQRFSKCPSCVQCSLDCSHFTQLVYTRAGFPYPYLPTASMLDLTSEALARKYQLLDPGLDSSGIQIGDLLVYKGHVVMVEKVTSPGRGDIVHATGGRDIKAPGQGIQRERFISFSSFRGPLLRILRHKALVAPLNSSGSRLRPVLKVRAATDAQGRKGISTAK